MAFVHLHVHTQYSILDGFSSIATLFDRAEAMGMPALAITDHGNMYGVKEFFKYAGKHKVKPIIGCEVYVTRHYDPKIKDNEHRSYYHLILLAKNYEGYKNLSYMKDANYSLKKPQTMATFNGFGKPGNAPLWPDHIHSRNAKVESYEVVDAKKYGPKFISDHNPVYAEFEIRIPKGK